MNYEFCECDDCRDDDPDHRCRRYSKGTTTCQEMRASSDWCQDCRSYLSDEYEKLKLEEAEEEKDREFDIKSSQGCI